MRSWAKNIIFMWFPRPPSMLLEMWWAPNCSLLPCSSIAAAALKSMVSAQCTFCSGCLCGAFKPCSSTGTHYIWSASCHYHVIIIATIYRHPVLDWNLQPFTPAHEHLRLLANSKLNDEDHFIAALGLTADLDELRNEYQLDSILWATTNKWNMWLILNR